MLEKELEIFEKEKAKLREENPSGGYVVIKGKEILGIWNDRQDALKAGIEKYGNVSFLVKDIDESNNHVNTFSRDFIFAN